MSNNHSGNSKNNKPKRRDFLNILLGGGIIAWLGALLFPVFKYLEPPAVDEVKVTSVKIGAVDAMEKDSGKIIKFGNKPVIVIRKKSGDNGRYDLNGRVASGPPPAPLKKYGVAINNSEVTIFEEAS